MCRSKGRVRSEELGVDKWFLRSNFFVIPRQARDDSMVRSSGFARDRCASEAVLRGSSRTPTPTRGTHLPKNAGDGVLDVPCRTRLNLCQCSANPRWLIFRRRAGCEAPACGMGTSAPMCGNRFGWFCAGRRGRRPLREERTCQKIAGDGVLDVPCRTRLNSCQCSANPRWLILCRRVGCEAPACGMGTSAPMCGNRLGWFCAGRRRRRPLRGERTCQKTQGTASSTSLAGHG